MGDVDGDKRDVGLEVLRCDGGRDGLVGLELDDEIDVLADELLGVAERDLRLIAVADDDELDVLALGRPQQARVDLAGERAVLPLGAVAELRDHFSALRRDFIISWYPGFVPSWGALYSSECLAMICVAWK